MVGFSNSPDSLNLLGITLALLSGIFYAYYILVVAYSNIKNLNSFVLAFYISLFNSCVLLIATLVTGNFDLNYTFAGLMSTVLVALFCNMIGMVAFQAGLKVIDAPTASILSTFEPITSLSIGVIILKETLSWFHIGGSLLIIASVVFVASAEKRNLQKEAPEISIKT